MERFSGRKRRRGDYDDRQWSDKRRKSKSPPPKKIEDYSHELCRFLEDSANVKDPRDFWRFHDKYKALKSPKSVAERSRVMNLEFSEDFEVMYDRIPNLDRNGEKIVIGRDDFSDFLLAIKIYQDFGQKSKFNRLKQLRKGQKDLPIAQFQDQIIESLKTNRVLLIAGDTGCGKSTQVPQYVLRAGYDKIVCTQPRRIACVSLAKRVAHETLTEFKSTVGYQIRFEKTKRKDTRIIFMTEGLLLRQSSEEETLNSYDVVILDEVHERHLHGDFLIGMMKCLLYKRSDFKLILMSATINLELFEAYFKNEQVKTIQVPGRLYPIDLHYRPVIRDPYEKKKARFDCSPYLQIIQSVDSKYQPNQKGDMLVFLNGYSEIATLAEAVNEYAKEQKNWIVLQLHSSLSLEEQDKVFDYPPEGVRKCIISTNIAETSVTIDGVRFVIDSGKVNRMTYHTNGNVNKLTETFISQDSAKQRSGRAGRTGPGVCFRLYSLQDFENFEPFTPAEIHLVPLESLLLHMISLGLSDIANFPFLEKPSDKSIEEGVEKLKFSGALKLSRDDYLMLTPLGDALSRLPVSLSIGKMLILSTVFENVNAVLALAALLSVQTPLTQQAQRDIRAQDIRKPLDSSHGDTITLLNYYREWLAVKQGSTVPTDRRKPREESSKTWAKKRCLEEQRFYETTKLVEQFREILSDANLLVKMDSGSKSSAERAIRHGELKHLKTLRRDLKDGQKSALKSRKQLSHFDSDQGDESQVTDLRDVEFRITNDYQKLDRLLNESSAESHRNLILLKLILTSGLYPQVALEDEFNSSKTVSERLFHTKTKNYVFLRPMSYFALNPEALELHDDDIEVPPPGYFSKRPISRKHQLLVYQTILETKKVFLVNVMRMPVLQTLVLFAKAIQTDTTLTKFVFDDFIATDLPHFGQGRVMLLTALKLRSKWTFELERQLKDPQNHVKSNEIDDFMADLVTFYQKPVSCNVRRLLPADLKDLYTKAPLSSDSSKDMANPFDADYVMSPNCVLGGIDITENVTYGCLVQSEYESRLEGNFYEVPFSCPRCSLELRFGSILDTILHEVGCRTESKSVDSLDGGQAVAKANSKAFSCEKCRRTLSLTPIEILKHKKSCN